MHPYCTPTCSINLAFFNAIRTPPWNRRLCFLLKISRLFYQSFAKIPIPQSRDYLYRFFSSGFLVSSSGNYISDGCFHMCQSLFGIAPSRVTPMALYISSCDLDTRAAALSAVLSFTSTSFAVICLHYKVKDFFLFCNPYRELFYTKFFRRLTNNLMVAADKN